MTDEQLVMAIGKAVADATKPTWYDHVDLMQVVLVAALGYMVWSLSKYVEELKNLRTDHTTLDHQVQTLQGAHNEREHICPALNRRKDDNE